MKGLKSCPFCGSSKVKLVKKNNGTKYMNELGHRVERHTYSVRCRVCFARGGAIGGLVPDHLGNKYKNIPEVTTDEDLEQEAIKLWNERA